MSAPPDQGHVLVWQEPVQEAWIDYNGHLSEPYYVLVFGHATDNVMDAVGIGPDYREANDASLYTVEAHVRYLDEVSAGADLEVRSTVVGATGKLLWIWHEMWVDGRLRATEEILGVHVVGGGSAPFPDDIAARARELLVDPPEEASGRIRPLRRA
ncbi:acyl-CoA thioester hydrolase [Nocardioides exalbidus]|uniref:Acyl-CoA thioester hydrolase n=1 Tax=Nocardioides exalbidus TaxID=402596 RepID=A0A1H4UR24_9ACTN|nr:thioesterase family protein [Nocardioides exalbidus]SEC71103.1 acyl-CoA thioester hydrolase [Nocardioides exalbidus]